LVDEISTFEWFYERYYRKHKIVEYFIDKTQAQGIYPVAKSFNFWKNLITLHAEGKNTIADILSSPTMVEDMKEMIHEEVTDLIAEGLSQRARFNSFSYPQGLSFNESL
jgi:hypothetical protein